MAYSKNPIKINETGYLYLDGGKGIEESLRIRHHEGMLTIEKLNEIWVPGSLHIATESLHLGVNYAVSAIGHNLYTQGLGGNGEVYAHSKFNPITGLSAKDTTVMHAYYAAVRTVLQPDNSGLWTGTVLEYAAPGAANTIVSKIYNQTGPTAATAPVRVCMWLGVDDTGVLASDQSYPASLFVANSEIERIQAGMLEFTEGATYFVRYSSDAPFSLKMDVADARPWLATDDSAVRDENLLQTRPWDDGSEWAAGEYFINARKIYVCKEAGAFAGTFTDNLDKFSTLGSDHITYNEVANFAALPAASTVSGLIYIVLASTGFSWSQRQGLYRSDGVSWTRLSNVNYDVLDADAFFRDDADPTKVAKFEVSGVSTGTTRTYTFPDVTGRMLVDGMTEGATLGGHLTLNAGNINAYGKTGDTSNFVGGYLAGENLTAPAMMNVLIGGLAGNDITTEVANTLVGFDAGNGAIGISEATGIGSLALANSVDADRTVGIGFEAGAFGSGKDGVYLGYKAGYNNDTNNKLFIGNNISTLIEGDFFNNWMAIYGNVGVGVVSPSNKLTVKTGAANDGIFLLNGSSVERIRLAINNFDAAYLQMSDTSGTAKILLATEPNTDSYINTGGNFGIGIIAPVSALHVYENTSNTDAAAGLTIEQDGGLGDAILNFKLTGGRHAMMGIDNSDFDKFKISGSNDLHAGAYMTIVHILSGNEEPGFVGIGTTTPWARLEVADGALLVSEGNLLSYGVGGQTSNLICGLAAGAAMTGEDGNGNTFLGSSAGLAATNGIYNTLVGSLAGNAITSSNHNTFVGYKSAYGLIGAGNTTAIGYGSLLDAVDALNTTAIGTYAGYLANANNGVYLGYAAGYNESVDNKLWITNITYDLIEGDFANQWVKIHGANVYPITDLVGGGNMIDVAGVAILNIDTNAADREIGSFINGIKGQRITVLKSSDSFNLTLEHRGNYGYQDIRTPDGSYFVIGNHGGVDLIFDGVDWIIVDSEKTPVVYTATGSDAFNVKGHRHIVLDTSSISITIGGIINGVEGQRITLIKADGANTLTIENMEATGNQDISTTDSADIVIGVGFTGGVDMLYTGGTWFVL